MSIPVNELVFAGTWDNATTYTKYQFVISPIDSYCYVYIGDTPITGGADPSVPNPVWVLLNNLNPPAFPTAYGSFSSTQTQNLTQNVVLPVVYDTNDLAPSPPLNVVCTLPSANISVLNSGVYKVLASIQCDKTTGGNGEIDMFIALNGTAVPNTATKLNLNQNEESVMTVEWFLQINAGVQLSVNVFSPNTGLRLLSITATANVPAIPSIITTITRIG